MEAQPLSEYSYTQTDTATKKNIFTTLLFCCHISYWRAFKLGSQVRIIPCVLHLRRSLLLQILFWVGFPLPLLLFALSLVAAPGFTCVEFVTVMLESIEDDYNYESHNVTSIWWRFGVRTTSARNVTLFNNQVTRCLPKINGLSTIILIISVFVCLQVS